MTRLGLLEHRDGARGRAQRSARLRRLPAFPVSAVVAAVGLAACGAHAYRTQPLTVWGDAYTHVSGHLVSAGTAGLLVLVGASARSAASRRHATRTLGAVTTGWLLLALGMVVEAVGGAIGDGSGDNAVHASAILFLAPGGLVVVAASALTLLLPRLAVAWQVRVALVAAVPAWAGLPEAASGVALALAAAASAALLGAAGSARLGVRAAADRLPVDGRHAGTPAARCTAGRVGAGGRRTAARRRRAGRPDHR